MDRRRSWLPAPDPFRCWLATPTSQAMARAGTPGEAFESGGAPMVNPANPLTAPRNLLTLKRIVDLCGAGSWGLNISLYLPSDLENIADWRRSPHQLSWQDHVCVGWCATP